MKVTLISPSRMVFCFGLRMIRAYLRQKQIDTRLVLLRQENFRARYRERTLDELAELCQDSALIGLSVMTNHFSQAAQVSEHLRRKLEPLILWGGIHPTVKPEECLEHADAVCLGEGEEAVAELAERLAEGRDFLDVRNLWFRSEGRVVRNELRPLVRELDSLPFQDFSVDDVHALDDDGQHFLRVDEALVQKLLALGDRTHYWTQVTRGCPHSCTYCCNNALRSLYKGQKFVRQRSNENVIEELVQIKERYDFVNFISIIDDTFFVTSAANIRDFCERYKERVGLSFGCSASPMTLTEEKLTGLLDAGMTVSGMGIQTCCAKTMQCYGRKVTNEQTRRAMELFDKYKDRMLPPRFDIILDNPYETVDDQLETFHQLLGLPGSHNLTLFSLTLFPGTELYEKATADGLLADPDRQVRKKHFGTPAPTYINFLFRLMKCERFPRRLLRTMGWRPLARLLGSRPASFLIGIVVRGSYHILRSIYRYSGLKGLRRRLALL